ncbi:MAG: pantoate--beta-alanine ligase [Actinobacteria bacterium]|nr:pantoate--beta-alanine ligase [Actinomycetota bacterium]
MRIVEAARELSDLSYAVKRGGQKVALVPTMGALHEGHRSLIHMAQQQAEFVIVSIFVNRLQFNNEEDFETYPVTLEDDIAICRSSGVSALYMPSNRSMYPESFSTSVEVSGLTARFEGASRPGHFSGVTTVVTKLLTASAPDIAIFGQKDFQQFAVLRKLVNDLDIPVDMVMAPTIREEDGLALSSRNVRLSAESRQRAVLISQGLFHSLSLFQSGIRDTQELIEAARQTCIGEIEIDYIAIVDAQTLEKVSEVHFGDVLLFAGTIDGIRLIDNIIFSA